MTIRPALNADHDAIWNIFHEIIAAGDTYAFDSQMPREEALAYWFRADTHTYVAERNDSVVGTYILRPNQSGPGSHVANAAFMVARNAEWAFALCNSISWFPRTRARSIFGISSVSKLSALCPAHFAILKKDTWMF